MTKLLDKALARVRSWSSDRQDDAARLLLAMDHRDAEPYKLTPHERDEIDAALAEVERGELASEEDVAAVFKRFGVAFATLPGRLSSLLISSTT